MGCYMPQPGVGSEQTRERVETADGLGGAVGIASVLADLENVVGHRIA
jgi:hypothetical protein